MAKSFVYGFVPYNVTIRYKRFMKLVQCVTLMPLFSFFFLEVGTVFRKRTYPVTLYLAIIVYCCYTSVFKFRVRSFRFYKSFR